MDNTFFDLPEAHHHSFVEHADLLNIGEMDDAEDLYPENGANLVVGVKHEDDLFLNDSYQEQHNPMFAPPLLSFEDAFGQPHVDDSTAMLTSATDFGLGDNAHQHQQHHDFFAPEQFQVEQHQQHQQQQQVTFSSFQPNQQQQQQQNVFAHNAGVQQPQQQQQKMPQQQQQQMQGSPDSMRSCSEPDEEGSSPSPTHAAKRSHHSTSSTGTKGGRRSTHQHATKPLTVPTVARSNITTTKPAATSGNAVSVTKTRANLAEATAAPTYTQVEHFDQLTDHQLATIDFKILLDLAHKAGFTEDRITEIKARRRRLKNRLSARICSNKKREKCSELEDTNRSLAEQVSKLKQENTDLNNLNVMYKKDLGDCHAEIERLTAHIEQLTRIMVSNGLVQQECDVSMAA